MPLPHGKENVIKGTDVEEASGEFGVWLRISGGENKVGRWPKNKKQGEPGEFYKILSNTDDMFMDSFGRPKEIRIHEFLQNIIKILKTTGKNKKLIVKNSRAKNKSGHNRKWPVINTDIDNIEVFFANCSPSESHETRMRLKERRIRLRKDNCGDSIKWFNLFCLACKRIQIFQKGKSNMKMIFDNFSHIFSRNDIEKMVELESLDTPWSIIDKEERADLYKNFVCFLTNYNNWIEAMPYYRDAITNNLAFLINNSTTPLSFGGTGQITRREITMDDGNNTVYYDTITNFVYDNLNRYINNTQDQDIYEFLLNSVWNETTLNNDYILIDYNDVVIPESLMESSQESPERCSSGLCNKIKSFMGYGGKKTRKNKVRKGKYTRNLKKK